MPANRGRTSRSALAASQSPRLGGISSADDIQPGHFVREQKILFGKRQKADLTARPGLAEKLICVEAKAVGIRIDSTKRLKELNDKHTDWIGSGLNVMVVGVCAGFFNEIELIATARSRGIPIFWEHNLDQLIAFVSQGDYYGSPWNARELFPDVSDITVRAGLESIQEAPKSIAEEHETYTSESEPDEF